MMAKILEVKTINGSRVMAKMAGMESTAKIISLVSIAKRTMNNGVKKYFLSFVEPDNSGVSNT